MPSDVEQATPENSEAAMNTDKVEPHGIGENICLNIVEPTIIAALKGPWRNALSFRRRDQSGYPERDSSGGSFLHFEISLERFLLIDWSFRLR